MSLASYLDTHTAILGASGAGKTVTAKVHVESLLDARRHACVIDPTSAWWGLRSDALGDGPGFDIPIFGGPRGDVVIAADQGEAIGAIIAGGASAIVDVSGLRTGAEQRRFVRDLCRRLRAKPDGNFHLVVDEADEFAAQKPRDDFGFQVGEEVIWMAKRGRLAGFVLTLVTQRPASIDKEVLTQAQTLIVHQLVAPVDQKPVVDYLRDHADKATLATIKGSLASLDRGERYVYSPRLGLLERGVSPMPRTFDSSRTPAAGEQAVEPKMLASIDIDAIRKALTMRDHVPEAGKKVDGGEVSKLRARLAELEADVDRLHATIAGYQHAFEAQAGLIADISWPSVPRSDGTMPSDPRVIPSVVPPASAATRILEPMGGSHVDRSAERAQLRTKGSEEGKASGPANLNAAARKMIDMLDRIAPARVTWASLAAMVGNKARGGNFNAARKAMRESGLVAEDGDTVRSATAPAAGMSREDAFALWKGVLSNPAPRMMVALMFGPMTRAELGAHLDIAPRNGVAQLIRNGVAVDRGGVLHLAEPLPGERA